MSCTQNKLQTGPPFPPFLMNSSLHFTCEWSKTVNCKLSKVCSNLKSFRSRRIENSVDLVRYNFYKNTPINFFVFRLGRYQIPINLMSHILEIQKLLKICCRTEVWQSQTPILNNHFQLSPSNINHAHHKVVTGLFPQQVHRKK